MVRQTKCETKVSANDQPTAGNHKHPIQEAAEAERRLISRAAEEFDEFQILRFRATSRRFPSNGRSGTDREGIRRFAYPRFARV